MNTQDHVCLGIFAGTVPELEFLNMRACEIHKAYIRFLEDGSPESEETRREEGI